MFNDEDLIKIEPSEDYVSQINARTKIVDILTKIETKQAYSDKLMDRELKDVEESDRRFVTEIVNGVLRWRLRLDWYLNQLYLGEYESLIPDVKNNLRSSVYQLAFMDKVPPYAVLFEAVEIAKSKYHQKTANLVNAVLRNFLRQQKKFEVLETQLDHLEKISFKCSHPKWLVQRWIEYWGIDEVIHLCEANNKRPRLMVRLNKLLADEKIFFNSLDENDISYEQHPDFPDFVWIDDFQDFRKLDLINKGWVSVQDVSTGMPVIILDPQPGDIVLDMCAAPGGKSGFILEKMNGQGILYTIDRHLSRTHLVKDNLERMNYQKFHLLTADSRFLPLNIKFDRILLDAPCSGLGVINKRVDLKWKRTEVDIENMKKLQLSLLEKASEVIKEDGRIVYSTCTIEPEENEKVIETFLSGHKDFDLVSLKGLIPKKYLNGQYYVQTFPHKHQMDGSFAACLEKKK